MRLVLFVVVQVVFVLAVLYGSFAFTLQLEEPAVESPVMRLAGVLPPGLVEFADQGDTALWTGLGAALVLYLAVSFWLAGGYAIMLRGLRNAMRGVTQGEITMKLPERGHGLGRSTAEQFNQMVKSIRKKLALQKYVSQSTSKMIEDLTTGEYISDASRRDVTVFFSDIRDFTPYAEENDPLDVVDTLNAVFALQVEAIVNHSGDIDKFIGDEVMAVFPGPSEAFQAAMKIQQKMKSFNRGRKVPLHVGIGIHSGEAVMGAVGAGDFYNYTTIGNTVNVGKRLCSAAEPDTVLLSEDAFQQTKITRRHTQRELKIKGIRKRLQVREFT